VTGSDGMQGGGQRGEDDHNDGSNALSPNNDNNGADKEEAAVNIVEDKGEDFAMGLMSIHQDDATTMIDALLPLLAHCPLPLRGLPLQQDNRMAGAKNAVASATTAAKVGIVAHATSSNGAVTNAMDVIAWWQSRNNINNNNDNNDQWQ
jgi:hypothetical protein